MRVLIVDDEPLARENLRLLLQGVPGATVAGECRTGREAIQLAARLSPDVVFLDIRMPRLDGFEVVERLGGDPPPLVVFVTAYDEHAVRAFDAPAVDYLLKPFDDARFARAIVRLRERLAARAAGGMAPLTDGVSPAARYAERLVIREVGRMRVVRVAELDWVEAEGVYCRLHAGGRSDLLRSSMDALEDVLDPVRFARVHRSAIVNVTRIAELAPAGHGDYVIRLTTGQEISLSRRRRQVLDALLAR
ncbi:MAG: LytR/AlgR family response regulator transcription factor [Vicinamibacterales bacterium]